MTTTLPEAQGVVATDAAITVTGSYDGKMQEFQRSPSVCSSGEGGQAETMFILEDGASLSNAIIGEGQGEGVYCMGTCTLTNVWFSSVCEDAFSFRQTSGTSYIKGGGAFGAKDKIIQFNGAGTVHVTDFYAENYGKVSRSCGNCDNNGEARHIILENVKAVNGGELCGVNENYGDTCTIIDSCASDGVACTIWEGNAGSGEPTKLASEPDGKTCIDQGFSATCSA